MGCLHEFDHRITHSIESDQMAGYQEFSQTGTDSLPQSYLAYFAQIAPLGDYFIAALPHEGYDPDAFAVTSNTPTQQIEQGTIIDVGHKAFGVLPLTGHSPGSIGFWDQQTSTLFSGDAVYDGLLFDDLPDSDITDYIDTMKRLKELPVDVVHDVVHGGHEKSFGRQRLHEIINEYLAARDF